MSKLALVILSLITFNFAEAQSFKVVKIQGKKAIVEMSDPSMVSLNQTYNVGEGSSSSAGKGSFKRDNAIAAGFSFTSASGVTNISADGTYLWNLKTYEFGPRVRITNSSGGGASVSTTSFGGLGYYNFTDNKPGVEGIPSVIGALLISSGSGSSTTTISAGGNYRWFVLSGDHAFSFSALYNMIQASGSSTSNFEINGGIVTYF